MSEPNTNGNIPLEQGASTEARAAIVRDTKQRKKERLQMIKNGLQYKVCYLFFYYSKVISFPRCLGPLTLFLTLIRSYGFFSKYIEIRTTKNKLRRRRGSSCGNRVVSRRKWKKMCNFSCRVVRLLIQIIRVC